MLLLIVKGTPKLLKTVAFVTIKNNSMFLDIKVNKNLHNWQVIQNAKYKKKYNDILCSIRFYIQLIY